MRILGGLLVVLLSACTAWERTPTSAQFSKPKLVPVPEGEAPAPPRNDSIRRAEDLFPSLPPAEAPKPPAPVTGKPAPVLATAVRKTTAKGVSLTLLAFDDRKLRLTVADKEDGTDTSWPTARDAARSGKAIAAINAGFFTPEGKPLGLVIENGNRFGSWNTASSLTSGVVAALDGRPQIVRRKAWGRSTPADHLVQAGPFLLENREVVSGLSKESSRPRSFIAWDGRHHWILGHTRSATLHELAVALSSQPHPGLTLETALNLDGGRSSDLFVDGSVEGGPISTRVFWNKPVRNYVLLSTRSSR